MEGQTRTILLVIFGLLMLGIMIAIVAIRIWPMIRYGPFSPCWGVAVSKLGELKLLPWEKEKQETIQLGDCINSLHIITKDHLREEFKEYCEETGESYMVMIPILPKEEQGVLKYLKIWEWPKMTIDKLKRWWKEDLGGIKPVCKVLDKPLCENEIELEAPGTYCIKIQKEIQKEKEKDCYRITAEEGSCENEGD